MTLMWHVMLPCMPQKVIFFNNFYNYLSLVVPEQVDNNDAINEPSAAFLTSSEFENVNIEDIDMMDVAYHVDVYETEGTCG